MNQIIQIANKDLNTKWLNYNQTRLKGDKKTANKLLNNFIDEFLKETPETIELFVYEICKSVLSIDDVLFNNGTGVSASLNRIQHPLFKKVLLPVFVKKYKENDALYIRWIGQLQYFFYSDDKTTQQFLLDIDYKVAKNRSFSTAHFYEKSYLIDPKQETLELLLKRIAVDIFYATHELPTGILWDADVFIKEVEDFKFYFEKSKNQEKWRAILDEWIFIGKHWKIYSSNKSKYQNFKNYLIEETTAN